MTKAKGKKASKAALGQAEQTLNCPICKQAVPLVEFGPHVVGHSAPGPAPIVPVPQVTSTPPGLPPGFYQPPNPKTAVGGQIPPPVPQTRNPFLSGVLLMQISSGRGRLENCVITGVRQGVSKFGASWSVDLAIGGAAYTLTVKKDSAKHVALWKKFQGNWVGQAINLRIGNPAAEEKEHIVIEA